MPTETSTSIDHVSKRFGGFFDRLGPPAVLFTLGGVALRLAWIDFGILASVAGAILLVRLAARPSAAPVPPPPRAQFTVSRERRLREALKAIKESPAGVLILSGHSGVGKTVLTRAIVDALKTSGNLKVVERNNYGLVQADALLEEMRGIAADNNTLFVLDQLEKVFLLDPPSARHQLSCLRTLVSECLSNPAWTCVLVVRREWFLNLTFFENLRPLLGQVHVIGGFDPEYEQPAYDAFRRQLIDLLSGNTSLVDEIVADTRRLARTDLMYTAPSAFSEGRITDDIHSAQVVPVQALAVVDALRFLREHHGQEQSVASYQKVGRFRGVMRLYFSSFLEASGEPKDAARVLAALSIDPRSRRSLSDIEISSTTSLPLRRTRDLLDFFTGAHLLQRVERRYDWIHDFFAESFNELSGSFLNPAERDNISNFWERIRRQRESEPPKSINEDVTGCVLSLWLFSLSAVILWSRALMLPVVNGLPPSWLTSAMLRPMDFIPATIVDFSFLPVALSLTAWSWYTTTLFRRVFCRLEETRGSRLLSYLVTVTSTLLVCLSVLFPRWWIALTGLGGFLVGLKYLQVGRKLGEGWRRQELFFGRAGLFTCLNSLFTLAMGAIYAQVVGGAFGQLTSEMAAALSFISMVIMVYFAYQVSSLHLDRNRVPLLVGIYRRYATS